MKAEIPQIIPNRHKSLFDHQSGQRLLRTPMFRSSSLRDSGSILLMGIGRVSISRQPTVRNVQQPDHSEALSEGVKCVHQCHSTQTPHCASCTAKGGFRGECRARPAVVPQVTAWQHRHHRRSSSISLWECIDELQGQPPKLKVSCSSRTPQL